MILWKERHCVNSSYVISDISVVGLNKFYEVVVIS